jgi:hypothetical protein
LGHLEKSSANRPDRSAIRCEVSKRDRAERASKYRRLFATGLSARRLATSTFGWPCRLGPTLPYRIPSHSLASQGGLCESRSEGTSHAPGLGRDQPRTSSRYRLRRPPSLLLVFVLGHRQPPSHQHCERHVLLPPDRSRSKVEDGRHVTGQHREWTDGHVRLFVLLDLFSLFRYVCVAVCVCGWITGKRIMEDNGRLSSAAIDVTEDGYRNDVYRRIMRKENTSSKPERKEGSL